MNSPYFLNDSPVRFGPPPGLADIMAQRSKQMQQSMDSIGNFAGALGGGVAGAAQGAADPGVMGASSSGGGAAQGFLRNFANIGGYGGGSGGGQGGQGGGGSAFANMVNGGGGGTGGMTVKQLQAAGKTADAFRDQMSLHSPQVEGQDPKVMGATDDEWKTFGAADKWSKVQGFVQGQVQSEVGARLQQSALQGQLMMDQLKAEHANAAAWKQAGQNVAQESPDKPRSVTLEDWAQAAQKDYPEAFNAKSANPFLQELAGRWRDKGNWHLQPGQQMPGPFNTVITATSPNSAQIMPPPGPEKPSLVGESVPELDDRGQKTGNTTMKVSGDPDQVEAWTKKQNTARQERIDNEQVSVKDKSGKAGYVLRKNLKAALAQGFTIPTPE